MSYTYIPEIQDKEEDQSNTPVMLMPLCNSAESIFHVQSMLLLQEMTQILPKALALL